LEEIGQVTYPGFKAPLWKISFKPCQPVKYRVWINTAIHGNEPASAEFIAQFVVQLAQSPYSYEQTAIDIIPIVNPWGWVHDIRFNKDGIIDAPMLGLWYMRLTGQLSIANDYRLANSQAVFAVETPESLLWEDHLRMQKTAVEMLIENFAKRVLPLLSLKATQ
jgi:hypothetical protein